MSLCQRATDEQTNSAAVRDQYSHWPGSCVERSASILRPTACASMPVWARIWLAGSRVTVHAGESLTCWQGERSRNIPCGFPSYFRRDFRQMFAAGAASTDPKDRGALGRVRRQWAANGTGLARSGPAGGALIFTAREPSTRNWRGPLVKLGGRPLFGRSRGPCIRTCCPAVRLVRRCRPPGHRH